MDQHKPIVIGVVGSAMLSSIRQAMVAKTDIKVVGIPCVPPVGYQRPHLSVSLAKTFKAEPFPWERKGRKPGGSLLRKRRLRKKRSKWENRIRAPFQRMAKRAQKRIEDEAMKTLLGETAWR